MPAGRRRVLVGGAVFVAGTLAGAGGALLELPARFERLYSARGGVAGWVRSLFERPSADPIRISAASAPLLLNLLWPLGLSNRAAFNARSPLALAGADAGRFASTGSWRLRATGMRRGTDSPSGGCAA